MLPVFPLSFICVFCLVFLVGVKINDDDDDDDDINHFCTDIQKYVSSRLIYAWTQIVSV